jgi:FKBP-type peptidyl-prolyl cis-trans isomerase FklB
MTLLRLSPPPSLQKGQKLHKNTILTKSNIIGAMALVLLAGCDSPIPSAQAADGAAQADTRELTNDMEKASYSLGYTMAANVEQQFGDGLDTAAFLAGIEDHMTDRDSALSPEEANASLQALVASRQTALSAKADESKTAGQEFLLQNGAREGVATLPSGLQYEVITSTEGPKPVATDEVTTHYQGTLVDGTVFDSSYERGQPATFPLNGVIAGWTEALQLMSVGSKYRLFIPPELAYGPQDQGPIPGNSTLIFEVELLEIK